MNKEYAIKAMKEGKKVTHRHFTPDEWITVKGGYYEFEDGCLCTPDQFWSLRIDGSWSENWSLFDDNLRDHPEARDE
jgi:hypothetical protein